MKSVPNYIAAALLSAVCLCCYYFDPYRGASLATGLLLQVPGVMLVFLTSVTHKDPEKKFTSYAKTQKSRQILEIGVILFVFVACGAFLLVGIKWSFVRFVAFLGLWITAALLGENANYFIWCRQNPELAQQLIAREKPPEKESSAPTREKPAAAFQPAERASLPSEKTRPRMHCMPDMFLAIRLIDYDVSALEDAIRNPSKQSLAALEEAICRFNGNPQSVFYRIGGMRVHTAASIDSAKRELYALCASGRLLDDPAYAQSLIAGLDQATSMCFMQDLAASNPRMLFAYRLLGVQMQIAHLAGD
ncbi:MAG TPA: hypothetical protein P5075_05470 [Eubacteriales bacterium]|nr:hypothetical protein [Eubacteriales bacterium]